MRIAFGTVQPDAGEIRWDGATVRIAFAGGSAGLGIGMVFQHFALFESLTVTENVRSDWAGPRAGDALADDIRALGERYGLSLNPDAPVHALSVGERQRVEIIRALLQAPRLLIMDEPTSVLTPAAVDRLFGTLRQLAGEGCRPLHQPQARRSANAVFARDGDACRQGHRALRTGARDRGEPVADDDRQRAATDAPRPAHARRAGARGP